MEKKIVPHVNSDIKGMTVFNKTTSDYTQQPMFFGVPLGIQRYDVHKFPVFNKLTQQQLGAFWRPEAYPLTKDRGDYQKLRPEQKHIVIDIREINKYLQSIGENKLIATHPFRIIEGSLAHAIATFELDHQPPDSSICEARTIEDTIYSGEPVSKKTQLWLLVQALRGCYKLSEHNSSSQEI